MTTVHLRAYRTRLPPPTLPVCSAPTPFSLMQSLMERCSPSSHHFAYEHEEASSVSCVRLHIDIRILNP